MEKLSKYPIGAVAYIMKNYGEYEKVIDILENTTVKKGHKVYVDGVKYIVTAVNNVHWVLVNTESGMVWGNAINKDSDEINLWILLGDINSEWKITVDARIKNNNK